MTSEEQYQQLLQMDRLGVTTGRDQRLLASIAAGDISIADAFPVYTPAPQSSGPGIGFGDSYVGPAPTSSATTEPDPNLVVVDNGEQTATAPTLEELLANQNFVAFLEQLGLANLASTLAGGMNPYANMQTGQPTGVIPMGMMAGVQTPGVAPFRRGYLPPLVVNPASISEETGLLQYVANQGQ